MKADYFILSALHFLLDPLFSAVPELELLRPQTQTHIVYTHQSNPGSTSFNKEKHTSSNSSNWVLDESQDPIAIQSNGKIYYLHLIREEDGSTYLGVGDYVITSERIIDRFIDGTISAEAVLAEAFKHPNHSFKKDYVVSKFPLRMVDRTAFYITDEYQSIKSIQDIKDRTYSVLEQPDGSLLVGAFRVLDPYVIQRFHKKLISPTELLKEARKTPIAVWVDNDKGVPLGVRYGDDFYPF